MAGNVKVRQPIAELLSLAAASPMRKILMPSRDAEALAKVLERMRSELLHDQRCPIPTGACTCQQFADLDTVEAALRALAPATLSAGSASGVGALADRDAAVAWLKKWSLPYGQHYIADDLVKLLATERAAALGLAIENRWSCHKHGTGYRVATWGTGTGTLVCADCDAVETTALERAAQVAMCESARQKDEADAVFIARCTQIKIIAEKIRALIPAPERQS